MHISDFRSNAYTSIPYTQARNLWPWPVGDPDMQTTTSHVHPFLSAIWVGLFVCHFQGLDALIDGWILCLGSWSRIVVYCHQPQHK